jgi:hypothetical protein
VLIKYLSWRLTRLMAKGYDPHTQPPLSSKGASGPRDLYPETSAPQNRRGDGMALSASHNRRLCFMGILNEAFIYFRPFLLFP